MRKEHLIAARKRQEASSRKIMEKIIFTARRGAVRALWRGASDSTGRQIIKGKREMISSGGRPELAARWRPAGGLCPSARAVRAVRRDMPGRGARSVPASVPASVRPCQPRPPRRYRAGRINKQRTYRFTTLRGRGESARAEAVTETSTRGRTRATVLRCSTREAVLETWRSSASFAAPWSRPGSRRAVAMRPRIIGQRAPVACATTAGIGVAEAAVITPPASSYDVGAVWVVEGPVRDDGTSASAPAP